MTIDERLDLGLDLAKLTAWLESNVPAFSGPISLTKFPGGQSNPTYRVDAGSGPFVLRRKPFGPVLPSAHAVDREFRLLAALHPVGFPVARPIALCEDENVIGAPFYVMELVEGRIFWNGALPEVDPTERRTIYEGMVDALARLHSIDPASVGLSDFGRPGNYFERQIRRWTKQYRAAQTDDIPEIEALIEYLPLTVPDQTRVTIIHGDYRIDNLVFAEDTAEVRAVLDWELSTLGDPLADFTYFATHWTMPAIGGAVISGIDHAAHGIPTLEEVIARYCETTQREPITKIDWYLAYNLFRFVGILQGIKKRAELGNASNADAEAIVSKIEPLAGAAWRHARAAGAPAVSGAE